MKEEEKLLAFYVELCRVKNEGKRRKATKITIKMIVSSKMANRGRSVGDKIRERK